VVHLQSRIKNHIEKIPPFLRRPHPTMQQAPPRRHQNAPVNMLPKFRSTASGRPVESTDRLSR